MKKRLVFLSLLVLILAIFGIDGSSLLDGELPSQLTTSVLSENDQTYLVTRVIDGDTIEIDTGQKVRYIGINTPETSDPRKDVECFGKEAKDFNNSLVAGKRVTLEKDVSETDRYGRLLRYVFVESANGKEFVNDILVRDGYAKVATYPPDVKYEELFIDSQRKARSDNLGLWKTCET